MEVEAAAPGVSQVVAGGGSVSRGCGRRWFRGCGWVGRGCALSGVGAGGSGWGWGVMETGRKQGAEDLEGLLGGLKLSEEEWKAVKGAWQSESREAVRPPQAVGKLFSARAGYVDGMVQTLGKIWCPTKGIRCKELGDNMFLFAFLQPGGKRRAVTEGPWEFGGDLLIVVDFDETKRLKDLEFTHIPVWIRVFNLPLGLMNESTGHSIGEKVGKSLDVETDEDGSAVGSFLRIKALIDVRKPLFRGVMVENGDGEPSCWCNFRFEFLPNFCYSCGLLGHVEKECDEKVWKVHDHQFGDWLRASPARKRDQRSRWSGGSSSGGSHQHKSSGSWRRGEMGRRLQQNEEESRGKVMEDNELRDDGSSPLKTLSNNTTTGGVPKKLIFGDSTSTDKESRVELVGLEEVRRVVLEAREGDPGGALQGRGSLSW